MVKKYILSISALLLVSASFAQPIVTAQADEPNSYRNTHIGFEYLNFKLGNYESGSNNNSTALAAGLRIDTELRKLKLAPRIYIENGVSEWIGK